MLAIGLGVSLALVFGVATVALAAVPGDPFKLGKVNIINNATTSLQGTVPNGGALLNLRRDSGIGPVLKVEAVDNGGFARRGIDITVPPGQSPISANSNAGKANLDVNLLDGKDQTDFLSASRIYEKTALKNGPGQNGAVFFSALDGPEGLACDEGDVALDASANAVDINDDLNQITRTGRGTYQIEFQDNAPTGSLFRVSVVCSGSAQPFRD
jgi:hypothetical protein